jgi:hypothetical protein
MASPQPSSPSHPSTKSFSRVDWRWATTKGFYNSKTKLWNEALGGLEEYLRQRDLRKAQKEATMQKRIDLLMKKAAERDTRRGLESIAAFVRTPSIPPSGHEEERSPKQFFSHEQSQRTSTSSNPPLCQLQDFAAHASSEFSLPAPIKVIAQAINAAGASSETSPILSTAFTDFPPHTRPPLQASRPVSPMISDPPLSMRAIVVQPLQELPEKPPTGGLVPDKFVFIPLGATFQTAWVEGTTGESAAKRPRVDSSKMMSISSLLNS